ncbi:hypothetical protein ETAA8_13370 [Anatilimnocola aggregata]|uniref:Uncharacterized protein n=1 Tax=Anatilimnocola aggregata TaxID=2528021 RepID=A0A517Y7P6_9BACT|nr:hypothetical protein [Anatilimnocola aggregata]QDU26261.1 hypothetical protein ETAA8_13370 [Anatilimnocola aggregata]
MSAETTTVTTAYGEWIETPSGHELFQRGGPDPLAVHCSQISWRPSWQSDKAFPVQEVAWEVFRVRGGDRRFVPAKPESYVPTATCAGSEMLERVGWPPTSQPPLSVEQRQSYRLNQLLRVRAIYGQQFIQRDGLNTQDLYVRRTGRGGGTETSSLPSHVGKRRDGSGQSWSFTRLTKEGRAAAVNAGIQQPTEAQSIAYGLTAAAFLNPLEDLSAIQIRDIVLSSLFECSRVSTAIASSVTDEVADRLLNRIDQHSGDTYAHFSSWFGGRKSNLVNSLTAMKGCKKLDRELVNAALLCISWDAYEYSAGCLSAFAHAFMLGLREPMNNSELTMFSAMHLPQSYLGGLPFVLLRERSEVIGPIIRQIWTQPDNRKLHAVLHRLLSTYAEIIATRREADRRFKKCRRPGGMQASELTNAEALDSMASRAARQGDDLQQQLGHLLERRELGCLQCLDSANWEISPTDVLDTKIHLSVRCARHDFGKVYEFLVADLEAELRRYREW